jgi:NADPH-dependent 2,4-dienoyl-CoA reductase/sulfur reductase-like enzyme
MTTEYRSPESYTAFNVLGKALLRVPVATRSRIVRVIGRTAVQAVEVESLDTGARRSIECDTVLLTGDWIPERELARTAGVALDPATQGPLVDTALRTSHPGIFAAGNLRHPVDTADTAALDGAFVGDQVAAHLDGPITAGSSQVGVRILSAPPFRWIRPGSCAPATRLHLATVSCCDQSADPLPDSHCHPRRPGHRHQTAALASVAGAGLPHPVLASQRR